MTVFGVIPRYVARETLVHALGVLAVVLGVFLVRRFGSLLGDATEGALPLLVILHLLGLRTVMALPSLLPVVVYAAVLLALGRFHHDNEMTALAACGVGPARTRNAVLMIGALAAAVVGILSFSVRPWAADRFEGVKRAALVDTNLASLRPGRFYELDAEGKMVLFAERRSRTERGAIENVFVQDRTDGRLAILSSDRAVEYRDEQAGSRVLRLIDGYRYDLSPEGGKLEITQYEELAIRTPLSELDSGDSEQKATSAVDVYGSSDPEDIAEVQWRLAMPVSTLLLALLAVPLSRAAPRQGRAAKLFVALLLYTAYRDLLSTMRTWVAGGTVPPLPGTWAVHGACLATALALIAFQRHAPESALAWSTRLPGWRGVRARFGRVRPGER